MAVRPQTANQRLITASMCAAPCTIPNRENPTTSKVASVSSSFGFVPGFGSISSILIEDGILARHDEIGSIVSPQKTILIHPSVNKLLDQQPWAKAKVRERPSASHSPPMLPSPHVPEIAARARASCFPRLRAGSTQLGANLLCRPGQKRARGPDRSPTSVYAPLYAGQMAKFDLASALTRKECVPSACARSA